MAVARPRAAGSGDVLLVSSKGQVARENPFTGDVTSGDVKISTNPFTDAVRVEQGGQPVATLRPNVFTDGATVERDGQRVGTFAPNLLGGTTYTSDAGKIRMYRCLLGGVSVEGLHGTSRVFRDFFGSIQVSGPGLDPVVLAEAVRELKALD